MTPKIGIFDPGFSLTGHYVAFDRYVAELIGDDFQVVFLDIDGRMRSSYEGKLNLKYPPAFATVINAPTYPGKLSLRSIFSISWWHKRFADFQWCKKAFKNIADLKLDLVIITSQNTPLIYLQKPQFRFCAFTVPLLIETRESLKGPRLLLAPLYDFLIKKYFVFLREARSSLRPTSPRFHFPFPVPYGCRLASKNINKKRLSPEENF